MLIGYPWAVEAWQGQSWWWSAKINVSITMWLLYTAYLHARLYIGRRFTGRFSLILAIVSFLSLIFTYLTTYLIPGVHSYG
jgi:ABC-type transport system involved in cytochrome c biogenesis permease subunit